MEKLIDITSSLITPFLDILLQDKTTKKNIIWATDSYQEFGEGFRDTDQIKKIHLLQQRSIIKPRIQKSLEAQQARTRKKAEVFTPAWLCNMMNNYCDEVWFGRKNVFNRENEDHTWSVIEEPVEFPQQKYRKIPLWQRYIDLRRLEITCGEAPYLVSRYDVSTGELIYPLKRRIGILDRKLRIVNENTNPHDYETWIKWVMRAFRACYGYEYQGDNVLLARINLFLTFIEYYQERWGYTPDKETLEHVIDRIVWNIWQMDGLRNIVPQGKLCSEHESMDLFGNWKCFDEEVGKSVSCRIYNWRQAHSIFFDTLKRGSEMMDKKQEKEKRKREFKFDFVIGNPPYQEQSDKNSRQPPVYNIFMDASEKVAKVSEFITPARFLFNAGQTSKTWNQKKLQDEHFKVLVYEEHGEKIFPGTDIKGGVAITIHNNNIIYGKIGVFTPYLEMNTLVKKVMSKSTRMLDNIISSRGNYRVVGQFFYIFPFAKKRLGKGTGNMIASNFFEKLPEISRKEKTKDDDIKFLCRINNCRSTRYIAKQYIQENPYLYTFNVAFPKSNGNGKFGEKLTETVILRGGEAATDTFISIGQFATILEAEHLQKYIRTKFFRALLSVKKVTQDNPKAVFALIPMQNFTNNSDIDWSQSIHEIDLQLYKKYDLTDKEIQFIEEHVKEMV